MSERVKFKDVVNFILGLIAINAENFDPDVYLSDYFGFSHTFW